MLARLVGKTIAAVETERWSLPHDEFGAATFTFTDGTELQLSVTNNEGVYVWTDAA